MASSAGPSNGGQGRAASVSAASENSQTAQEYAHLRVVRRLLTIWCRFISSQLQLEADAREALPYVCCARCWSTATDDGSNSILVHGFWDRFARLCFRASHAIRLRIRPRSRTALLGSVTRAPSPATASIHWLSCLTNATLFATVAPRVSRPDRHARFASMKRLARKGAL
jgi:hypothetical protein